MPKAKTRTRAPSRKSQAQTEAEKWAELIKAARERDAATPNAGASDEARRAAFTVAIAALDALRELHADKSVGEELSELGSGVLFALAGATDPEPARRARRVLVGDRPEDDDGHRRRTAAAALEQASADFAKNPNRARWFLQTVLTSRVDPAYGALSEPELTAALEKLSGGAAVSGVLADLEAAVRALNTSAKESRDVVEERTHLSPKQPRRR
jgi:hypothetical protein